MGRAAWGNHTCPDPAIGAGPRSKQRHAIIVQSGSTPQPSVAVVTHPNPAGVDRQRTARVQSLLEVTADGLWGVGTDARAQLMRAFAYSGNRNPGSVRLVQGVINTAVDGQFGQNSVAALRAWVRQLQIVLPCGSDGGWGPVTEAAYQRLRGANLGRF